MCYKENIIEKGHMPTKNATENEFITKKADFITGHTQIHQTHTHKNLSPYSWENAGVQLWFGVKCQSDTYFPEILTSNWFLIYSCFPNSDSKGELSGIPLKGVLNHTTPSLFVLSV